MDEQETKTAIEVQLTGTDGNAFVIMGKVVKALRKGGRGDLIDQYTTEATSGDYDQPSPSHDAVRVGLVNPCEVPDAYGAAELVRAVGWEPKAGAQRLRRRRLRGGDVPKPTWDLQCGHIWQGPEVEEWIRQQRAKGE